MAIRLYNTLTKSVENFRPIDDKAVNMFVCGPTVYDLSHLGHARTYIFMDVLARIIKHSGYEVFYLQNITDIDDKIIKRSNDKKIDWKELGSKYISEYLADMKSLNNTSVTEYAKATDYIEDIIKQVQILLDKGHAYSVEGDGIYFEISTFPDYGKLSGRTDVTKDDAQSRIDHSEHKRGWNDFCLWKFSKDNEPEWNAPFGAGRPGWHIEDTAIAEHFFGTQYDIHGGAIDLIFPHHEAEITQMESISDKSPFVKYWVHTGFLTINNDKMSKSLDNFHTIKDIIQKGYNPMAIRLFILQSHYRSQVDFTFENLNAASNRLNNWRNIAALRHQTHDTIKNDGEKASDGLSLYVTSGALLELLQNDIDTPKALALIDEAFSQLASSKLKEIQRDALIQLLEAIDEYLGLKLLDSTPDITDSQKQMILERKQAKLNSDFKKSDLIRHKLEAEKISLKDNSNDVIWGYIN